MGGNLFRLGRLPKADYIKVEESIKAYLDVKFGNLYRIPRYYSSKADFGDVDIILSKKCIKSNWQDLKQEIIIDLGLEKYKSTGAVFSTVYKNFQVDYFVREHQYLESIYQYLSFNDIGNIIGRIYRRMNLKYGEQGLTYVFRREDNYKKDIPISTDFKKIFAFIGLDYSVWETGFHTLDDMFSWVTSSPFFSIKPYMEGNKAIEKRKKRRLTMVRFSEYLERNQVDKVYVFDQNESTYLQQISDYFPEANLLQAIEKEKDRARFVSVINSKCNGRIIISLFPELKGQTLGQFIPFFRQQFRDYEEAIYKMTHEEIVRKLKLTFQKFKNSNDNLL